MQKSLAGVLLLLAGIALSVAAGSWWLQRAAFSPSASQDAAEAILNEAEIRAEITSIVAQITQGALEESPNEIAVRVDQVIGSRPGATLMAELINDSYVKVLGLDDAPVVITGEQLSLMVRDERAGALDPVTYPVPRIGTLTALRSTLRWLTPIMGALGLVLALLALAARPDRREITVGIGELALATAVSLVVFGYAIPVQLLPAVDDSTWTTAAKQLALRHTAVLIGTAVVLAIAGAVLMLMSRNTNKRRQWSTPMSVARYRDDRSWS